MALQRALEIAIGNKGQVPAHNIELARERSSRKALEPKKQRLVPRPEMGRWPCVSQVSGARRWTRLSSHVLAVTGA